MASYFYGAMPLWPFAPPTDAACLISRLALTWRRFYGRSDQSQMPELGKKYTCYSCHTKFYDLGKPEPICPKCGADQRDADEAPVVPTTRSRRAAAAAPPPAPVEEVEDNDFVA